MIETIDKDNLIGIVTMVDCLRYTVQELQDDFLNILIHKIRNMKYI